MPDLADFTSNNEVIIWPTPGAIADSQGRTQFTAFWLAPSCVYGIRGQVFNTDLNAFVAHEQEANCPVTVTQHPEALRA